MITINGKTIIKNIKTLRSKLPPNCKVCAVIKTNAYSLGDVKVAHIAKDYVDMFAISRVFEGVRLRSNGILRPILVLGVCDDIEKSIENKLIITVGGVEEMRNLCKVSKGRAVDIHIKVNTGMSRFGIANLWHLKTIFSIAEKFPNVKICGIYSHFSHEANDPQGREKCDRQLKVFAPFRAMFKRHYPCGVVHCACSGTALYPPAQFDMVRVGKALYGGFAGFKTALCIRAKVILVRQINKNAGVGYGGVFTANESVQVGVVNAGYADAMFLLFAPISHVYVGKILCPILGAVCMDNFMVDVSAVEKPMGKTVTIVGDKNGVRLTDIIRKTGQSGARILTSLNRPF